MDNLKLTDQEYEMLTPISVLLGLDKKQHNGLLNSYQAVKIQGHAFSMDIRQFVSLGIPLIKALSDVKSISLQEVVTTTNNHGFLFTDIEFAFKRMTSEHGIFRPVR